MSVLLKLFYSRRPARILLTALVLFCVVSLLWLFNGSDQDNQHGESIYANHRSSPEPVFNASLLKAAMDNNQDSIIYNTAKFQMLPVRVIAIQVHKRIEYLRAMIDTLRSVKDIEETLIIFSHDYIDDEINKLIKSIEFVRYAQIFYPFSNQIWFGTFPGQSPTDCPRDMKKKAAIASGCSNAMYPDRYGHYRESRIAQTKHHWWWKIRHIFEHFAPLQGRNFELVLLEEDYYIVPDFIHVWKKLSKLREENGVELVTLGNYEKRIGHLKMDLVHRIDWWSSKHNMGIVINRKFWRELKAFSKQFCSHDDYNWDWTLQFMMKNFNMTVQTLIAAFPRVIHIGTCGLHVKNQNCSPNNIVRELESTLLSRQKDMFPAEMTLTRIGSRRLKYKPNGGWGDVRDHELCEQYSLSDLHILKSNPNFAKFV